MVLSQALDRWWIEVSGLPKKTKHVGALLQVLLLVDHSTISVMLVTTPLVERLDNQRAEHEVK